MARVLGLVAGHEIAFHARRSELERALDRRHQPAQHALADWSRTAPSVMSSSARRLKPWSTTPAVLRPSPGMKPESWPPGADTARCRRRKSGWIIEQVGRGVHLATGIGVDRRGPARTPRPLGLGERGVHSTRGIGSSTSRNDRSTGDSPLRVSGSAPDSG